MATNTNTARIQTILRKATSAVENVMWTYNVSETIYRRLTSTTVGSSEGLDVVVVKLPLATTPTLYNLTLTNANTQYAQILPTNSKSISFRCRTAYDIRYAFETGKVASPTEPYMTLPSGGKYSQGDLSYYEENIYFASSQAGVVVEIEVWA